MAFISTGRSDVDPQLRDILAQAAAGFPGYDVRVTSGLRPGDPRFHGRGMAEDIQLIDQRTGKPLPNYQDASTYGTYKQFADAARAVQQQRYPALADKFRWGGYFWDGGPGSYGSADLMHFDLGGSPTLGMGGGSWAGGPSAEMMRAYSLPAATAGPLGAPVTGGRGLAVAPTAAGDTYAETETPPVADLASLFGLGGTGGLIGGSAPPASAPGMEPMAPVQPIMEAQPLAAGLTPDELSAPYVASKSARDEPQDLASLFRTKAVIGQGKALKKQPTARIG